jgi:hypothetical protein
MDTRVIKFTEDFATKKKGEVWEDCPAQLSSTLVRFDKVAVYTDVEEEEKPKAKKVK